MRRTVRTSISYDWALDRPPISLTFAVDEHEALSARAASVQLTNTQWIAKVISYATDGRDIGETARDSHLALGEWVRIVVLEALELTQLREQISQGIRRGRKDRRDYDIEWPKLVGIGSTVEAARLRFEATLAEVSHDGFEPVASEPPCAATIAHAQHTFGYQRPVQWRRAFG